MDMYAVGVLIHYYIFICHPFTFLSDTEEDKEENIKQRFQELCAKPDFEGGYNYVEKWLKPYLLTAPQCEWLDRHPELIDVLNRLLELNPRKRMTAEQALKHPFFSS